VARFEQHRHHHRADVASVAGYQNSHPSRSFIPVKMMRTI
jgi:hypothetical protein